MQAQQVKISEKKRDMGPRYAVFPEIAAGGFARGDTTIAFYTRVLSILKPEMTVLDYGAGRGKGIEDAIDFRRELTNLMPHCKKLVAADIDPAVMQNERCHEAVILKDNEPFPFEDESFDMIMGDWVFEHIADAEFVTKELNRILKPGGWLCARTPNKYGYVGIGASLVPNQLHAKVLKKLTGGTDSGREAKDVFPTQYNMNRKSTMRALLPNFDDFSYYDVETLNYFQKSDVISLIVAFALRFLPRTLYPAFYIFMRKR